MNQGSQKNIAVQLTEDLMFDKALISMREIFVKEMQRIEDEMNKLGDNMTRVFGSNANVSSNSEKPLSEMATWQLITNSPLVVSDGADKKMKLQFDVSHFDPNEIQLNIANNKIVVTAKHEKRSDNSTVLRQYYREFQLPRGLKMEDLVSSLSKEGVLTVEAPLPTLEFKQTE